MKDKFGLDEYFKQVVKLIREKEANMRRGNIALLEELDAESDEYLLRKWSWISAIVGVAASFVAMPLLATCLGSLLPDVLREFVWAFIKVSMGMSLVMFGVAIYFTVCRSG